MINEGTQPASTEKNKQRNQEHIKTIDIPLNHRGANKLLRDTNESMLTMMQADPKFVGTITIDKEAAAITNMLQNLVPSVKKEDYFSDESTTYRRTITPRVFTREVRGQGTTTTTIAYFGKQAFMLQDWEKIFPKQN